MADNVIEFEVRKATLEDYQGVLDINKNVYEGLDYVPNIYDQLVTDPDLSYYVCIVDGEVGAFEGVCLLDNNNSLMERSSRVKDKFKSLGLLSYIKKRIYEDYKDIPGEKNLRASCNNLVHYVHSKTYRSLHKTLLVEFICQFQEIDVRQMSPVSRNPGETKTISMEQFSNLLEIEAVQKYLFPENLITMASWFFDAVPSNIRHLEKWCSQMIITKPLSEFLSSLETTNTEVSVSSNLKEEENYEKKCPQGILGIVSHYFSPCYLLFAINFFGRPSEGKEIEEMTSFLKHALSFLQTLYSDKSKDQKAVCGFVSNKYITREILHEAGKPFGLLPSTWEPLFTEQYYFEQEFDKLLFSK